MAGDGRFPFSNGTEERWWQSKWCDLCVHDHSIHDDTGGGCDTFLGYLAQTSGDYFDWPESWVPNHSAAANAVPPTRFVCLQFEPCAEGDCTGDPGAEARAGLIATTVVALRERSVS